MISAGEVGATLVVVDRASAILKEIAAQFERLDVIARKTQESLERFKMPQGVTAAIGRISANFEKVGTSAENAARMVTGALGRMDAALAATEARVLGLSGTMRQIGGAAPGGGRGGVYNRSGGGGGGGHGGGGSGGVHVTGHGIPLPGGAHVGASHGSDGFWELIGGVALAEFSKKFIESNMEMGRLESRAAASKTTSDRMGEIMTSAWKNANDNLNTTATQSYRYILELTQVTGSVDDALKMLPVVSKLQASLSSLKDEDLKKSLGNSGNAYTTARSLELLGVTQDPAKLNSYASTLLQAFSGMQGTLNPQQLFQTIQNAGGSRYGWNEDFVKHYVGPLTQASSRAGAGLYQLDRSYGAGVMTELMANNLIKYGFISKEDEDRPGGKFKGIKTGSMAGYDMLRSNPEEWALKVALPLLQGHGVDVDDTNAMSKAIQEISRGNKNLGVILDELMLPGPRGQLAKEAGNIDKAQGDAAAGDPWMKVQAFQTKWNDLMNALGAPVTDRAMAVIDGLTKGVNTVAQSLAAHPALANISADMISLAGGALLLSGSLGVLKLAMSGFSLFGGLGGTGGAAAAGGAAAGGAAGGILRKAGLLGMFAYLLHDADPDGNLLGLTSGIDNWAKKHLGFDPSNVPLRMPSFGGGGGGSGSALDYQTLLRKNYGDRRNVFGGNMEAERESRRGAALSNIAAPSVSATLQATVNTTVPFTVNVDGQAVANAIMPKITQLIQQAMSAAAGQLMGHTNEVSAYHGAGIGHN